MPLLGVSQKLRAAVIEQNNVKFLRSIWLTGLTRAAQQGVVTGQRLASPGRGEHRKKKREIREFRQDFLNADDRDVNLGQGGGKPGVAFVFRDGNHARFRDGEIGPADTDVGLAVFQAHDPPGGHGQFLRIVGGRGTELVLEKIR